MTSFEYLLYTTGILTLLTLFYWLFLKQETFFKANRWVLLGTIGLALFLPILPQPSVLGTLKTKVVERFPTSEKVVQEHPITVPSPTIEAIAHTEATSQKTTPSPTLLTTSPLTNWEILKWLYLVGVGIMLIRFLTQLIGVYQEIKASNITKGAGYYLATHNKNISPFSFWKYIVLNPNKYNEESFLHILEHERIHVTQQHTIDMILAELFLIVQWFNPIAWLHRHFIDQNLEYLVDQTVLENGENKKTYQYHLVQVAVPNIPLSISSNYNYSQLKNRIKMMNVQRSSLAASWKYALLLPVSFLLLVAFTNSASEQETAFIPVHGESTTLTKTTIQPKQQPDEIYVILNENAQFDEIMEMNEQLTTYGLEVIVYDLQYNPEQTIESIDIGFKVEDEGGIFNRRTKAVGGFESIVFYRDLKNNKVDIDSGTDISLQEGEQNKYSKFFEIGETKKTKDKSDNFIKRQVPKNAKEVIIIITEETSIEEIKEVQEELLNYGVRLEIDNIQFNKQHDKITALTATVEAGGHSGTSVWDNTSKDYSYMVFYFNPHTGHTHNGVNVEIKPIPEDAKLFILGKDNSKKSLQFLRNQSSLKRQQFKEQNRRNNQNPNWKGYSEKKNYIDRNLMPETLEFIKQQIKQANPNQVIYKVDGMEWGEEAFDIPTVKMEQLKWSEWSLVKYDDNKKEISRTTDKIEIEITRKANPLEVPSDSKITMPATFRPNGTDAYTIDGIENYPENKIRIMDKFGTLIYDAQSYKNDWKGVDRQGQVLKPSIYIVMLYLEEEDKKITNYVEILPVNKKANGFVHEPHTTHYLVCTCTEDFLNQPNGLREEVFMRGYRASSLNTGPHKNLLIIRNFGNYEQAVNGKNNLEKRVASPDFKLYPISKTNYQKLLKQASLDSYIAFYKTFK